MDEDVKDIRTTSVLKPSDGQLALDPRYPYLGNNYKLQFMTPTPTPSQDSYIDYPRFLRKWFFLLCDNLVLFHPQH